MIRHAGRTDPGRRRDNNEDALLLDIDNGVFAVADGVGGREAGEVASALAIDTLRAAAPGLARAVAAYAAAPDWSARNAVLEALDAALQQASQRIYEEAEAAGKQGMTTTIVVAVVGGGAAFLAHVGDSRAWLVREGHIKQLTEDHSMVNELVRAGQMSFEEAKRSRYRNVITRALGLYPTVQADVVSIEILPGDRVVLASDGLSDPVPLDRIGELAAEDTVDRAAQLLVDAANDAGGPDNVTAVVVEPEATLEAEVARARAQVMQDLFLFHGLPFHVRLRVSRICEEIRFTPEQKLVVEGAIDDRMFVIVQGEVRVSRDGVALARLGPGQHFGELGLLEDQERSASVYGATAGSALVIQRARLQEFCQREPGLGNALLWRLLTVLGARLRDSNAQAARTLRGDA
jgi:serine/threonine protein phosphatase PrpC